MSDSFDSSISTPVTEIDFEHLNRYVAGDPDLTREVFGLFRNQVEMWGRGLRADVDDDMWANVTHSLKGSARAVGGLGAGRSLRKCRKPHRGWPPPRRTRSRCGVD